MTNSSSAQSSPPPEPDNTTSSDFDRDLGTIVRQFTAEIDGLAETLPLAMVSIENSWREAREDLMRFLKPYRSGDTFRLPIEEYFKFEKVNKKLIRTSAAFAIVPRTFLVALVSQYDAFLGSLIRSLLLLRPEILNGSDRQLLFSDLVKFVTLDDARNHIIEKEVETVLRKSHTEQFDWMEKKFGLDLRKNLGSWHSFVEITERRNLCVHTGGKVSSQYLQVCKNHDVPGVEGVTVGQELRVPPQYYAKAYETIYEIGVKLCHVLWRKLKPDDRKAADENLNHLAYSLLAEERFTLAIRILDFAVETVKTHYSNDTRMRLVVNRIQAYKWAGDEATARRLLDNEDFSAANDSFNLAAAVLAGNDSKVFDLVRRIGRCGTPSIGDYRHWPLFRVLRSKEEFDDVIFEVFGERLGETVPSTLDDGGGERADVPGEAE